MGKVGVYTAFCATQTLGTRMLQASFQHFERISARRELDLWRRGIASWDEFECIAGRQLTLFGCDRYVEAVEASRAALRDGDVAYFADRLPRPEHYRIAYAFPQDTLFLDIETTGLSLVYDHITIIGWSIGHEFNVYRRGEKLEAFIDAISRAKVIVTFNGSRFDIPFIRQEFPEVRLPPAHIDLRFFARRAGIGGPQKVIEDRLGIGRDGDLKEVDGKAATVLWHDYCRGNLDALRKLVLYNHADVEGMKTIFDVAASRLFDKGEVPNDVRPCHAFANQRSSVAWDGKNNGQISTIRITPFMGRVGPVITYDKLSAGKADDWRFVGIDLTGSESRPSGWCELRGRNANTQMLRSDDEIFELTMGAAPLVVSIDSPLSIPMGRVTVSDDDPARNEFGITRWCERELRRRGVNVYPCLIPSMQRLTERGIRLAKCFRQAGVPVIESYPGAAQDILGIPRKGTSLNLLKQGLQEFGLRGDWLHGYDASHDELDAITSALVGLFWWRGAFEALGNSKEDFLIIPDIGDRRTGWELRHVVGFSGCIGAGKTTAAEKLASRGYHYARFSEILAEMLQAQKKPVTRRALQDLGAEVHRHPGQRWLCLELIRKLPERGNLVIDGLRHPEDHATLVERFGPYFTHVYVETDARTRAQRRSASVASEGDYTEAWAHPVEENIPLMKRLAHSVLLNHGDLTELDCHLSELIDSSQGGE